MKPIQTLPETAISTAKHTPGEWVSCPGQAKQRYRIETKGTGNDCEPIAECKGPDREANARLIASAPDLLAALERLVEQHAEWDLMKPWSNQDNQAQAAARAAIAKATQGK